MLVRLLRAGRCLALVVGTSLREGVRCLSQARVLAARAVTVRHAPAYSGTVTPAQPMRRSVRI